MAEPSCPVGIEREGHRGLPDTPAPQIAAQEECVALEPVDDARHRLGGKAREPRDPGFRQYAPVRRFDTMMAGVELHVAAGPG